MLSRAELDEHNRIEDAKRTPTHHTPTPWIKDFSGKYYKPCLRSNGLIVCTFPSQSLLINGYDERQANADLILKAVNSFEAMREALESIANLPVHPADDARNQSCLQAALGFAKAALALTEEAHAKG